MKRVNLTYGALVKYEGLSILDRMTVLQIHGGYNLTVEVVKAKDLADVASYALALLAEKRGKKLAVEMARLVIAQHGGDDE